MDLFLVSTPTANSKLKLDDLQLAHRITSAVIPCDVGLLCWHFLISSGISKFLNFVRVHVFIAVNYTAKRQNLPKLCELCRFPSTMCSHLFITLLLLQGLYSTDGTIVPYNSGGPFSQMQIRLRLLSRTRSLYLNLSCQSVLESNECRNMDRILMCSWARIISVVAQ